MVAAAGDDGDVLVASLVEGLANGGDDLCALLAAEVDGFTVGAKGDETDETGLCETHGMGLESGDVEFLVILHRGDERAVDSVRGD